MDFLLAAVLKEQLGYYSPPDYKRGVFMKMNLQYFADQAADSSQSGAPEGTEVQPEQETQTEEQPQQEKTFTQQEVNDIVKKRLDRALKDKAAEVENAKSEAAKLAKMNSQQKQDYKLKQAEDAAAKAKADLARYQMRDTARNQLIESGFNPTDADIDLIVTDKAETTQTNVKALLNMVDRIKESVRNDLLKGKTPKAGGAEVKTPDATQFKAMDYASRVALKQTNPELYKQLVSKTI